MTQQATLTITEALAEIKTIGKRIAKKREGVPFYLARVEAMRDPLEKEGGSASYIQKELQSISDLEERIVSLRRAIASANATTDLSVNGDSRTIADWLTWRREVAPQQQQFVGTLRSHVENLRRQAQQKSVGFVTASAQVNVGDAKSEDIIVNVSETDLMVQQDHLQEVLGLLDGLLSLKNATTTVAL